MPVDGPGPYTAEVELRYQAIGYRWADNLSIATAKTEGTPASAF